MIKIEQEIPGMVIDRLELSVAYLGKDGEHVEWPGVPHLQVVGLGIELPGASIVGGRVDLLLVPGNNGHDECGDYDEHDDHDDQVPCPCTWPGRRGRGGSSERTLSPSSPPCRRSLAARGHRSTSQGQLDSTQTSQ